MGTAAVACRTTQAGDPRRGPASTTLFPLQRDLHGERERVLARLAQDSAERTYFLTTRRHGHQVVVVDAVWPAHW